MIDWNTTFTFTRTKGIIFLLFLVIGLAIPFNYNDGTCAIRGIGFPAPMYTKERINCGTPVANLKDLYGFNIFGILFNSALFYALACTLLFLYTNYGPH